MPAGADIDLVICSDGWSLPGVTVGSRNHPQFQLFDVHLEAALRPNHDVVAQVLWREVALRIRRPDPVLQFKNDDMIVFDVYLSTKYTLLARIGWRLNLRTRRCLRAFRTGQCVILVPTEIIETPEGGYASCIGSPQPMNYIKIVRCFLQQEAQCVDPLRVPIMIVKIATSADEVAHPDCFQISNDARINELLGFGNDGHVPHVETHHQTYARLAPSLKNPIAPRNADRHGFFQVDVFPRLKGCGGMFRSEEHTS